MGHHSVTTVTYKGTDQAALTAAIREVASIHREEEGSFHSVSTYHQVVAGVSTPDTFFQTYEEGRGDHAYAQLVYGPKDLQERTFKVTVKVKDLQEATSYAFRQRVAREAAEAKGLHLRTWKPVRSEGELQPGITGRVRSQVKAASPLVTRWEVRDPYNHRLALCATRKEAQELATQEVLRHSSFSTLDSVPMPTYALHKVSVTEDGAPAATVEVSLVSGKLTLEVTAVKVKAGAKAAGWAITLDCHH